MLRNTTKRLCGSLISDQCIPLGPGRLRYMSVGLNNTRVLFVCVLLRAGRRNEGPPLPINH